MFPFRFLINVKNRLSGACNKETRCPYPLVIITVMVGSQSGKTLAHLHQAYILQRQRKGSVSSDASASTDSNTYYEDDFSSTEEDSSQGTGIASFF